MALSDSPAIVYIVTGLLVAWQAWRYWAFQIKPARRPEDPKKLPYWIPCEYFILAGLVFSPANNGIAVLGPCSDPS